MSAPPSITYLLLDAQFDPVFDPARALVNIGAVRQAILTRLQLWQGEWWENLNLGLPMFQKILGQIGSQRGQSAMSLEIQAQIDDVAFVIGTTSIVFGFVDGRFSFTCKANTSFGVVTVTNAPGASASLDS